jgi:putative transposase
VRIELAKEGWKVNTKRVHRVWRDEELQVRPRTRKRRRGTSTIDEVMASKPNEVWALDFQFDATADGRQLKLLHGVDEFTREALVMRVGRSCDADELVGELDQILSRREAPGYLRCDNGPEFIAAALKDWCRFSGAGTVFIEPGSPWQNPYVESFNARVRDELLNMTEFYTLHEATVLVADFQMDYNWHRPHSSLQNLAPAVFAERWRTDHQPARLS